MRGFHQNERFFFEAAERTDTADGPDRRLLLITVQSFDRIFLGLSIAWRFVILCHNCVILVHIFNIPRLLLGVNFNERRPVVHRFQV
jgi:hypothetical protein